jgi:hypothetical protein
VDCLNPHGSRLADTRDRAPGSIRTDVVQILWPDNSILTPLEPAATFDSRRGVVPIKLSSTKTCAPDGRESTCSEPVELVATSAGADTLEGRSATSIDRDGRRSLNVTRCRRVL